MSRLIGEKSFAAEQDISFFREISLEVSSSDLRTVQDEEIHETHETRETRYHDHQSTSHRNPSLLVYFLRLLSTSCAYLLTTFTAEFASLNPLFTGMIFHVLASFTLPPTYSTYFFVGAYAGMIDFNGLYRNIAYAILGSVIATILTSVLQPYFIGAAGKLGTIAFLSNSLLCLLILGLESIGTGVTSYEYPAFKEGDYENLNVFIFVFGPLLSATAAWSCYMLLCMCDGLTNAKSYGLVGVFGLTVLQTLTITYYVSEDGSPVSYGTQFMSNWNIGTFVGGSTVSKYEELDHSTRRFWYHYLIVGYLSGWVGIGFYGIINVGGKHGFNAFIAFYMYYWTNMMIRSLWSWFHVRHTGMVTTGTRESR